MQMFLLVALFFICFIFLVFLLAKIHYKNEELRVYETSVMEADTTQKQSAF
jgi:preprotein translocase subunit SecG